MESSEIESIVEKNIPKLHREMSKFTTVDTVASKFHVEIDQVTGFMKYEVEQKREMQQVFYFLFFLILDNNIMTSHSINLLIHKVMETLPLYRNYEQFINSLLTYIISKIK
jgi:hypothetical protein